MYLRRRANCRKTEASLSASLMTEVKAALLLSTEEHPKKQNSIA
jgi:hypothetical protein